MSNGLTKKDMKTIIQVFKKYPEVETAVLYGSRALGTYQRGSDIDIALKGKELTSSICSHIHFKLEEETLLPYFFDITDYQSMKNEKLKEHIDRVGKVIYGVDDGKLKEDNVKLPRGWVEAMLGDVIRTNTSSINNNFKHKWILYLDTGSIKKGKIENLQKVKTVEAPSRAKRLVKHEDIIYSTVRPNQEHYGYIVNPKENFVVSTGFTVIENNKGVSCSEFLYYFLTQKKITNKLQQTAEHSTSTYPSIKPSDIERIELFLPSLPEQKAIARVLSSLDAKIENLQSQNQTLEKIAQTLFKQWFVDFNFPCLPQGYSPLGQVNLDEFNRICTYKRVGGLPAPDGSHWFVYVILCEDGTFYKGITQDLYSRFYQHFVGEGADWTKIHKPKKNIHWEQFDTQKQAAQREKELKTGYGITWLQRQYQIKLKGLPAPESHSRTAGEMVGSELGEIPKGWQPKKLGEIISVNPKEKILKHEIVPYIDMKALSVSGMGISGFVLKEFKSGSKFRNDDILLARITPCLENGKTAFVNILPEDKVAFGSTEFIVLRGTSNYYPEYVYCLARSEHFRSYAILNMTGSSGRKRVPNDMVEKYCLPVSNTDLEKFFSNIVGSFFDKIKVNQKQIQTLTNTRDTLLPKLMSGQIRVSD